MADGCLSNVVKYALFLTNLLIFLLGVAVLGCGIWVLVDKPTFLNLFEQAESMLPKLEGEFDISLYTSAAYIIIVVAAIVSIVAFFGCFGAVKESKCMLGTYFVLILVTFIVMVVGAVLGYTGSIEETLQGPLKEALSEYRDGPNLNDQQEAYKKVWNEVQKELKCCGVENVRDWRNCAECGFANGVPYKVPEGCCGWVKVEGGWQETNTSSLEECRRATLPESAPWDTKYAFEGCFTKIQTTIEENQGIVSGVAIGVVAVMFLNMLFSFAMCTMVN